MTNNRRKESKLNSYIRKTVFKNKKIFLAGFMMILLIFIVVNTICSVETIKNEKNIIDGHALYGDMQAFVYNISLEKAMKISKDSSIDRFEICQERYDSDEECYEFVCDEAFFDMYKYKLLEGRFPEDSNEMVCEKFYLEKQGMDFKADGKNEIEYKGKTYNVTGIVCKNEQAYAASTYIPTFIFEKSHCDEKEPYAILIKTNEKEYAGIIKDIKNKYEVGEQNVSYNAEFLQYINMDENYNYSSMWEEILDVFVYVSELFLVIIVVRILCLLFEKSRHNYDIFNAIGVGFDRIKSVYSKTIYFMMAFAIIISVIIRVMFCKLIIGDYDIPLFTGIVKVLVLDGIVFVLVMVFVEAFINSRKKVGQALGNAEDIRISRKEMKFKKYKKFVKNIGNNTVNRKRKNYIAYTVIIVLSLTILNSFTYLMLNITDKYDRNTFDYRLDYYYSFNSNEDIYGCENIDIKYKEMKKHPELFDIVPIYSNSCRITHSKNCMSKEYIEFKREKSSEDFIELRSIDASKYSEACRLYGIDAENCKNIFGEEFESLEDNECFVVKNVDYQTLETKLEWGLNVGDTLSYELPIDLTSEEADQYILNGMCDSYDKELKVKKVFDSIKLDMEENDGLPIVIINMKNYIEQRNIDDCYEYPENIYLNAKDGMNEKVEEFFKSAPNIVLVDLEKNNENVRNAYLNICIRMFVMFGAMLLMMFINMMIISNESFESNKKQIAILNAIGVSKIKVALMQIYSNSKIMITGLIVGNITSIVAIYLAGIYIKENEKYFKIKIPFDVIMLYSLAYIVVIIAQILFIVRKVKRLKLNEALCNE